MCNTFLKNQDLKHYQGHSGATGGAIRPIKSLHTITKKIARL